MDELTRAWQQLQDAILVERFDKLPEDLTSREFADLTGSPPAAVRTDMFAGTVESRMIGRRRFIPKEPYRTQIIEQLRTNPRLRVSRALSTPPTRISSLIDAESFTRLTELVTNGRTSVRHVLEEAIRRQHTHHRRGRLTSRPIAGALNAWPRRGTHTDTGRLRSQLPVTPLAI